MSNAFENELVNVRNLGEKSLEGAFNSVPYSIPPGEQRMIGVECAKKDFGDWDSRNASKTESSLRFREKEYHRIRGHSGVMPGSKVPTIGPDGAEYDEKGLPKEVLADLVYRERLPKVEISLLDGTKVVTVLEDPEGADLPAVEGVELEQDAAMAAMRLHSDKLNAELDAMKKAIAELQAGQPKAKVDSPETAPRPRPKPAKVTAAAATQFNDD